MAIILGWPQILVQVQKNTLWWKCAVMRMRNPLSLSRMMGTKLCELYGWQLLVFSGVVICMGSMKSGGGVDIRRFCVATGGLAALEKNCGVIFGWVGVWWGLYGGVRLYTPRTIVSVL